MYEYMRCHRWFVVIKLDISCSLVSYLNRLVQALHHHRCASELELLYISRLKVDEVRTLLGKDSTV